MWKEREHVVVSPFLYAGIAGILLCTVVVAYFTPQPKEPASKAASQAPAPAAVEHAKT
jgi:hypothetical protein